VLSCPNAFHLTDIIFAFFSYCEEKLHEFFSTYDTLPDMLAGGRVSTILPFRVTHLTLCWISNASILTCSSSIYLTHCSMQISNASICAEFQFCNVTWHSKSRHSLYSLRNNSTLSFWYVEVGIIGKQWPLKKPRYRYYVIDLSNDIMIFVGWV
jgi:hypothetical protein